MASLVCFHGVPGCCVRQCSVKQLQQRPHAFKNSKIGPVTTKMCQPRLWPRAVMPWKVTCKHFGFSSIAYSFICKPIGRVNALKGMLIAWGELSPPSLNRRTRNKTQTQPMPLPTPRKLPPWYTRVLTPLPTPPPALPALGAGEFQVWKAAPPAMESIWGEGCKLALLDFGFTGLCQLLRATVGNILQSPVVPSYPKHSLSGSSPLPSQAQLL